LVAGRLLSKNPPKNDEPREVPVPKFVMAEIKKQIQGRGRDDLVFGDGVSKRGPPHVQQIGTVTG